MVKLTRLNHRQVVINPDNVLWADAMPDTTLCLASGERLIVRESLDELIELVVAYQQAVRSRIGLSARPVANEEEG